MAAKAKSAATATAKSAATATAAPAPTQAPSEPKDAATSSKESNKVDELPDSKPVFPQPKLRLEVRDVSHDGADVFFQTTNATAVLAQAVAKVQQLLYGRDYWHKDPATHMPPTRSVTVILRSLDGVAYTTGSELDSDHKEIHVSLEYVARFRTQPRERAAAEVAGVLTHELVHCYQWDGRGTCPGGLVEGIADWVRLHCALSPPHWKREPEAVGRWDGGYQHTGYFLDFLENRYGKGTVRRVNEKLRQGRYDGDTFWPALLGHSVDKLWAEYIEAVKEGHPDAS